MSFEYQSRVKALKSYLSETGLSAFLVLTKVNRQYLSGFTGSSGVVLVNRRSAELFVDDRYIIRARRESPWPVKNVKELKFQIKHFRQIGVEDKITLREFQGLKQMGKGFQVTKNVIESLRAVKTGKEIGAIRKGQRIIDKIFIHLKKTIKSGQTETWIALEIGKLAKKFGAQGLAFEPIVAWGPNAAAPHHLSSNQKIGKNNFLLLDYGVLADGYHSDFTRTLFLGHPNRRQEIVYNTVLEAQLRAISKIRQGAKAVEVDGTAREYIRAKKFGKYFTHNTGHGVGLEIHELPNFSPDSEDTLREDMAVMVEPGIYLPNWGGVRIEDMVIVAERPVVLSKSPKDLRSMIIK